MKYIEWSCLFAVLSAGVLAANPASVHAADVTNGVEVAPVAMADLVVTATRDARPPLDVPQATQVLNAERLRVDAPVRTVPEAFKHMPGVMVQKTSHGQGSPYIRGFTGYRNLFLIDGVRLNNSVFRDGPNQYWSTVDPFSLSRLELVSGPGSVLYGSDAIGGTVNALTRGVRDLRPGRTWDRRLYTRVASAEDALIGRAEAIGWLTDDLALTVGYSYMDFGDVEGGGSVGTQEKTGYDERAWDAKLEYVFPGGAFLTLAHQDVAMDDAWRTHRTLYGIDWEGLSVGNELRHVFDQDRALTYLQYHAEGRGGAVDSIHAGLSRHAQEERMDRLRTGPRHDEQGFDVETFGAFVSLKSPSPLGTLVYGAELYHDAVDTFSRTLNPDGSVKSSAIQGPVGDDATYDMLGLYLQDELALHDRLTMILGGRYSDAEADADAVADPSSGERISVSGDWDAVVGSARWLYALDTLQQWRLFTGVAQGFRAPNLSDLTRYDSARTDELETPAPDLDPERFVTYELGVKAESSVLALQLAYFYTDIADMIIRTPTGRVIDEQNEVTKRNAGDGYVQGVEVAARYRIWRGLRILGAFTWMDGEVETYPTSDRVLREEPIDRLMPPTGRVGLRWDAGGRCWVESTCTVAAEADDLSSQEAADTSRIPPGGTPGYTVVDVRAGWRHSEALAFSVAVENIGDEDYRVHGSGINEPGRNVVLAADMTF